ncbi:MAG: bifunctional phosphoribosylaminoimidazolecarboxamide formyltransferase/IMP cyclohydrolase [candidate division Zixibacteria bacterium]|nr:bifunctional phosphoribosylaminoimidazolecarboxamide formyltransferase/IMP cyclohydrolase [candidate division Zixibacteria bacterium]
MQAMHILPVRRALISVYDKSGLKELGHALRQAGVEIVSTGGTEKELKSFGIDCRSVTTLTGYAEILGGRVKTLHPAIFGGILAKRGDSRQMLEVKDNKLELIDLVVVNLYPFEECRLKNASEPELLENIDIGGPSMIRAAAKNFNSVAVVTSPSQYAQVIEDLNSHSGGISLNTRRKLASKAFEYSAYYDGLIADYFRSASNETDKFPDYLNLNWKKKSQLRYGENPHQKGFLYEQVPSVSPSVVNSKILAGKELSYNNILDLQAALNIVRVFDKPFAVVLKHNTPCGAACGKNLSEAYQLALESDPVSAYGGIVGLNQKVDLSTAKVINDTLFIECVIAPEYDSDALELLMTKKNRRILSCGKLQLPSSQLDVRMLAGGALVQDEDSFTERPDRFETVTEKRLSSEQMQGLWFGWKVCRFVKSNAIVICQGEKTVGIGAGQTSRLDSVQIAARKAGERAKNSLLASDAFFPMRDGIDEAAKAGVKAIIQPGGSKKDQECIQAANAYGIAMVFTGVRHFRH